MRTVGELIKHTADRDGVVVTVYDARDAARLHAEIERFAQRAQIPFAVASHNGWTNPRLLGATQVLARQAGASGTGMLLLQNLGAYQYPNLREYREDRKASEYRRVYVFGILEMFEDPSTWDDPDDNIYYARRYGDALNVPAYEIFNDRFVLRHEPGRGSRQVVPPPSADLALINEHRRKMGMRPLDPVAADWTEEDLAIEATRIRKLNPLKRGLLR